MEDDKVSTDVLTQLALKLLIDLLFYSGPSGHRRLWLALLDRPAMKVKVNNFGSIAPSAPSSPLHAHVKFCYTPLHSTHLQVVLALVHWIQLGRISAGTTVRFELR